MAEPELLAFEVIGSRPIRDAKTRESVRRGGVVHLDPAVTLIDPLIQDGHIKPATAKPKATH